MGTDSDSASKVLAALRGEAEFVRGTTFIAEETASAFAGADAGAPSSLLTAVSALGLDFMFIDAPKMDADTLVGLARDADVTPMWVLGGPFGQVARERGWVTALADVVRARDDLAAALGSATNRLLPKMDDAALAGANVIVIAEDLSLATGFLMGPDDASDLMLPNLSRLAREAVLRGMMPVLHSDGDIRTFMPAIAEAGYVAVHVGGLGWENFESQFEAARAAGLAVLGGIEGADLRDGAETTRTAGRRCAELSSGGGLLIADDGGVTTSQEFAALSEALRVAAQVDSGGGE